MYAEQLREAIISGNKDDIVRWSEQLDKSTLNDALQWAAFNGHLEGVQLLAPRFISPEESGDHPLIKASAKNHINVAKWICSNMTLNSEIVNWSMKYALDRGAFQCFTYLHSLCDVQIDDDDPYYKSDDDLIEWAAMCKNYEIRKQELSYLIPLKEWPQKNINKAFIILSRHQYRNMREDEISSLSSPDFKTVEYALKIVEDLLDFELLTPDIDTVAKCFTKSDYTVKGIYIKHKYIKMWNSGLRCSDDKLVPIPQAV